MIGGGRPGGGGFGMGGARGGGPARPSAEDMEQQRALLQDVMTLPARLTIAQDADKVTFIEPDGVSRSYLVNGKTEKHQLTHGTIETRSSWDDGALKMEIAVGGQTRVVRRFAVRAGPRRLEVATTFDGAPRDTQRLTVYEEAAPPGY
jgi:hypothetical protein